MDIMSHLSPFQYMSHKAYSTFWTHAFKTIFKGIGAKIIAGVSLGIGLWLLIKKDSIYGFYTAVFIAAFFAYFSGLLAAVGLKGIF